MATRGELKKALQDWQQWLNKNSRLIIPRSSLLSQQKDLCLALTGVRRSGKSSMTVQLALGRLNETFFFNFEDPIFFPGASVEVLDQLLSLYEEEMGTSPKLVILDEIQNVQGWERWVRKAIDLGHYQIVVTGSSSHLLSSEIATAISGRVIEQTIWPLSFSEYLTFLDKTPSTKGTWLRALEDYLRWGGFPKIILTPDENDRIILLKQYLSDIVLRDVVARHSIKNQQALHQIVSFYLTGLSCLHSYNALRKAFEISIELASSLTSYLTQAFLVFEMSRYHPNLKVQARDPKKIYVIDTGLRTVSLQSDRGDWGRLAENAVYLELRRRSKQVFYYKQTQEVDFVITELGKPIDAIQVCYSDLEDQETRNREINALLECLQALDLPSGNILTLSLEDTLLKEGKAIHLIPLYEWLSK
ncbi:MAG: ATP-binding protein [Verrucomicrobia bacterium]|nr:ATP-binding protein [Verrucomicrobiota bacterium]MBS0645569.1 ATP-binding protein [Verrucomicrobiota bacterium]